MQYPIQNPVDSHTYTRDYTLSWERASFQFMRCLKGKVIGTDLRREEQLNNIHVVAQKAVTSGGRSYLEERTVFKFGFEVLTVVTMKSTSF
jgi:hypothetical protein